MSKVKRPSSKGLSRKNLDSLLDAEFIVATVRESLVLLDKDMRIISANSSFYKTFQVAPNETEGKILYDIGNKQWDIPKLHELLETILPNTSVFNDFEVSHEFPFIGKKVVLLNARRLVQKPNAQPMILLAIEDITERKKAEEEILRAKEEWEHTFDSIPDPVAILDNEHRIVRVNKSLAQRLGVAPDECVGVKCFECVHKLDMPPEFCPHVRTLADGKEHFAEVHEDNLNGDFLVSTTPLFDQQGQIIGSVHVARDITERKKSERLLRESEGKYRSIVETAEEGIVLAGRDRRIIFANQKVADILGYSREEMLGKTADDFFVADAKEQLLESRTELDEGGRLHGEFQLRRRDGTVAHVLFSSSGILDTRGQHVGNLSMITDITERKKAEESLQRSEEQFRAFVGATSDVVYRMNPDWTEMRQLRGKEFIPDTDQPTRTWLDKYISPDDQQYVRSVIQRAIETKSVFELEHRVIRVDGSLGWTFSRANPILDQDGKITEWLGAAKDITERKKAEEELRKTELIARRRAEELERLHAELEQKAAEVEEYANRMEDLAQERLLKLKDAERMAAIGMTAGMVGHDIRNPLQSISGSVYLALSDLIDSPESEQKKSIRESLEAIDKSAEYINKIVQDLQDYARPLKPTPKVTDLKNLCEDALSKSSVPRNIRTSLKVHEDARLINSDPELLTRVMSNLIQNAIQAMPDGGEVSVRADRVKDDVVIEVLDTGVGVPEDVKPKLFTPLFTTKAKGQGFGLAVVKRVTEALGGTVTFESQEGKGTKFAVRLPNKG